MRRTYKPTTTRKASTRAAADTVQGYRAASRTAQTSARRNTYTPRNAPAQAAPQQKEKKGMDTDLTLSPIISTTSTNASSFVANLIPPGTGSWHRVGRRVFLKSLRIKGTVAFTMTPTFATGAGQDSHVRMVVIWDQQPSGAAIPTFDTIFGITDQAGTESCPDITCPPKYDNMDRFRILKDCAYEIPAPFVSSLGSAPSWSHVKPVDEYILLNDRECVYSGQSATQTIADLSTGAVYIFFRSYTNATAITAAFDGVSRLRYVD